MGTTRQNATRLARVLDGIWMLGDRDECSIKHIGHGTAALAHGKSWRDGVDYATPWGIPGTWSSALEDFVIWPEHLVRSKVRKLEAQWEKATRIRDEIGLDEFDAAMMLSKFSWYHGQFCQGYWDHEGARA